MILLLGGTADAAPLARALAEAGYPVLVSTATDEPLGLPDHPAVRRRSGPLDATGLAALLRAEGVRAVADATHPYAAAVRATARGVCRELGVPYLTLLRPPAAEGAEGVTRARDHGEAARLAFSLGRSVLLTTGSRSLEPYAAEARRTGGELAARVLDAAASTEACRRAGLPPDRVIAGRGPFTVEENREALRRFGARVLVTKDGGEAGGVPEKLEAARLEGCAVVLVERPPQPGENAFADPGTLVAALKRILPPER
ncbi:MAG: precorrin-6A reductase [Deferrisomatales bacterium]